MQAAHSAFASARGPYQLEPPLELLEQLLLKQVMPRFAPDTASPCKPEATGGPGCPVGVRTAGLRRRGPTPSPPWTRHTRRQKRVLL